MLTQKDAEKFADWIIKQEQEMMKARYPLTKKQEKELNKKTNEELLRELGL